METRLGALSEGLNECISLGELGVWLREHLLTSHRINNDLLLLCGLPLPVHEVETLRVHCEVLRVNCGEGLQNR